MGRNSIGIRREDKNDWERRAPLTPDAVGRLTAAGIDVVVQPSHTRVFPDEEYAANGARIDQDLSQCRVVVAIKEIPAEQIAGDTAYLFFSHTIKGQPHNMPLLAHVLDVGATLVDYEKVVGADGGRLIHFGRFAGLAGMLDGLWAYGRRLSALGFATPFDHLRPTPQHPDLASALDDVEAVGRHIRRDGLDPAVAPVVVGLTGYGNVAGGAREVLERLDVREIGAVDLPRLTGTPADDDTRHRVHLLVLREEDTVRRSDGAPFDLADYRRDPGHHVSVLGPVLRRLSVLVNAVYWDPRGPRLVTAEDLGDPPPAGRPPRPTLIADLSCDIGGGVEATVRATTPDEPVFVYDPRTGASPPGFAGPGTAVLAVDNLPCELPRESSAAFSRALEPFVPALADLDVAAPSDVLALPPALAGAVVAHRGRLAPAYDYLRAPLAAGGA